MNRSCKSSFMSEDARMCLPANLPQSIPAPYGPHMMLGLQILPQMHLTTPLPLMCVIL